MKNFENIMLIHDVEVIGTDIDLNTRCVHYKSDVDIIAIKFKCCEQWFPCFKCHAEHTNHKPEVWSIEERNMPAILCGSCGRQLTIIKYMESGSMCPACNSRFNPKCANHYELYFEIPNRVKVE